MQLYIMLLMAAQQTARKFLGPMSNIILLLALAVALLMAKLAQLLKTAGTPSAILRLHLQYVPQKTNAYALNKSF